MTQQYLKIAVPGPLRQCFDYLPPKKMVPLAPGMRVKVPFGARHAVGFLVAITDQTDVPKHKLKPVSAVLDDASLLSPNMLSLLHWISEYYHHSLGDVFSTALPLYLRQGKAAEIDHPKVYQLEGSEADLESLKRAPKQAALFSALLTQKTLEVPKAHAEFGSATAKALMQKSLISCCAVHADAQASGIKATSAFQLNEAQSEAIAQVSERFNKFQPFVLHGVTGSGKTEVYLSLIEAVCKQGKQALVLIPEISLTPQTVARFESRFHRVATLHSEMTDKDRHQIWVKAKQGKVDIIVGTRSAIFAPLEQLGIIIIDESHDLSFKQHEGLKYSARDVALVRARNCQVPVVLGSATPSLETLHNVEQGRFIKLSLPLRAGGAKPPEIGLIDVRHRKMVNGVSAQLLADIKKHLEKDEQVMLFLNQRGFAPVYMCHACGWIAQCEHCDARLTHHSKAHELRCHHCHTRYPLQPRCPTCQATGLNAVGVGTERLAHYMGEMFPEVPITRIDRDTTQKRGAMKQFVTDIKRGDRRILVGTQMLAKGHDFPNLTLVAVINADSGFFSPDFRAMERMGQLLLQVAGRAGRANKPGKVLIQTTQPEHPHLHCLINEGYTAFANRLLEERKAFHLPPVNYWACVSAESQQAEEADQFLESLKQTLAQANLTQLDCLGPIPAPMARKAGQHRAQLIIQSDTRAPIHNGLKYIVQQAQALKPKKQLRWSLDVDPLEM